MYAVIVNVEQHNGKTGVAAYGPYKTREKADDVRLALGEQALSAPATVDVSLGVVPLVRTGLLDMIERAAAGTL